MVLRRVQCRRKIARPAADVWRVARSFCDPWHPLITDIAQDVAQGRVIRAFRVASEDVVYRERLSYFSDTDRVLAYEHLDGISDILSYRAHMRVQDAGSLCDVVWSAEIEADPIRAEAVARGTAQIFEIGLDALEDSLVTGSPAVGGACEGGAELSDDVVPGTPELAVTLGPEHPGPLVLFLHGIGGARHNWESQMRALGHVARCAAIDLRGYGDSALGPGARCVEAHCQDILRVMAALGADKVILCGLSFGAWIATSFAMRHGEKMAGLVLSGGCTGMSEASAEICTQFRDSRLAPLEAGQTPADFAPQVVDVIAGPLATAADRAVLERSMSAIPVETYRDAILCFTQPKERFDFGHWAMPVLLMTGAYDRLAPPREIRSVAERIHKTARAATVRFEVLEDAGHVCNLEQPDAYNRHLTFFLSQITL